MTETAQTLKGPPFATPQEEITYLRAVIGSGWNLFCSGYLEGDQPDELKRRRAFTMFDRKCRELGILPPVQK